MSEYSEEISLLDLFLKIGDIFRYLLSKWVVVLCVAIVGGALGFTYAYTRKVSYEADLTFVLEDSKMSSLGAYAGIASQLGLDIGGDNSSTGVFSGDNILAFLKSRLIIENALLSDTTTNGKRETLADLYLNTYGFTGKWKNNPRLRDLSFPPESTPEKLSYLQDSIIQVLYEVIGKKNLTVEKPDKKLGFIQISTNSLSETFSKRFTEKLVNGAIDFYVSTKTQRSRTNVNNLQRQADSLVALLDKKTYNLALNQDLNLNPVRKVALIGTEISDREKMLLSTVYSEVVRNLEMAKMSLVQETPIIQIIDRPLLPLRQVRASKLVAIILSGFLGGVVCSLFLLAKRAYKTAYQKKQLIENQHV